MEDTPKGIVSYLVTCALLFLVQTFCEPVLATHHKALLYPILSVEFSNKGLLILLQSNSYNYHKFFSSLIPV